jgi:hypothetical protein
VSWLATPARRVSFAAVVTFAAGALAGFALGRGSAPAPQSTLDPALASWANATVAALDLSREQSGDLRILLAHYERERDRLLAERLAEADADWLELDRRFETLIQSRILQPEQRARAELLLAGSALASLPEPR